MSQDTLAMLTQALDRLRETASLLDSGQTPLPGDVLYQARRKTGLTQGQFAKSLSQIGSHKVTIQDIFNWEQNSAFMGEDIAKTCCEVLAVHGVLCDPSAFVLSEDVDYGYGYGRPLSTAH